MKGYFEHEFSSRDPELTREWLATQYGEVVFDRHFTHLDERRYGDSQFVVSEVNMRGRYDLDVELDRVTVSCASAGYGWEMGRASGDTAVQPALFQPGVPLTVHAADSTVQSVAVTIPELERSARLLYGDDQLEVRFAGQRPVNAKLATYWVGVAEMVLQQARLGALQNPLLRASTARLLTVSILEAFRLDADRPTLRASAERRRAVYRTAARFLEDHASLPVTIDDAARAAGASIEELVLAFRAHSPGGLSPTAHLRQIRLQLAHTELAHSPLGTATVRQVAVKWGFASETSFRRHYRAAFGIDPGGPVGGT